MMDTTMNTTNVHPSITNIITSRAFLAKLHRVCSRITGPSHDSAADAVQTAVERILTAAGSYDPTRPVEPWAIQVAVNAARNSRRDRRRKGEVPVNGKNEEGEETDVYALTEDTRAVDAHQLYALKRAVNFLAGEEREFVLALAEGATQQEAGARVGWNAVAACRRRPIIEAKLRRILGIPDPEDGED